jgi:pimeloyl-ACP methyl ester carboxylesterase
MQELARYWATEHDWRRCEAHLNALPNFLTEIEIDGLDIHFIHVRSRHEDALPLIVTHGWLDRGGHFAAWEQPQLFSEELRAAFRSLRA